MNLLSFAQFFLLYLVVASLIITGFYIITRGKRIRRPDGTDLLQGKILKGWSLFWERTTGTQALLFTGDELKAKLRWLSDYNSLLGSKLSMSEDGCCLVSTETISAPDRNYIRDALRCEIKVHENSNLVYLYSEEPKYYFPEFVRYPLSQCPPCMASVGGTLLYWPVIILNRDIFAWSTSPALCYPGFWILFCFALAALNKLAYKIIGE